MTLGFAFAVGELTLIAAAAGALTLPIWYRWSAPEYGSWHADSLGRALLHVPVGIAGLIVAAWLARTLGSFRPGRCGRCSGHALRRRPPSTAPVPPSRALDLRLHRLWARRRDHDHLGGDRRRLLLATVGSASAGAAVRAARGGRARHHQAAAPQPGAGDPRRRSRGDLPLPRRGLGGHLAWLLLARLDAGRPGERGRRALADHPQPEARPPHPPVGDARDLRLARSRIRTPSSAASSATCTTARRPGSSRSA